MPQAADPVWHLYVIRHPRRNALQAWLTEQGVQTLIHYPTPPHQQDAYATGASLPVAERLSKEVLSLPIGPHMTDAEIDQVIETVATFP